jgi:hypothetical protein
MLYLMMPNNSYGCLLTSVLSNSIPFAIPNVFRYPCGDVAANLANAFTEWEILYMLAVCGCDLRHITTQAKHGSEFNKTEITANIHIVL